MKCQIRKWKLSDAADLASALNNEKVLNYLRDGLPYPYTQKDAQHYINSILSSKPNETFAYAIDVDGKAVGSIGAFRQGNIHFRTAELGYYLAEEYWGKGIMTQAVKQLCQNCLPKRIYSESLQSPLPIISGHAVCLKKRAFSLRAY